MWIVWIRLLPTRGQGIIEDSAIQLLQPSTDGTKLAGQCIHGDAQVPASSTAQDTRHSAAVHQNVMIVTNNALAVDSAPRQASDRVQARGRTYISSANIYPS